MLGRLREYCHFLLLSLTSPPDTTQKGDGNTQTLKQRGWLIRNLQIPRVLCVFFVSDSSNFGPNIGKTKVRPIYVYFLVLFQKVTNSLLNILKSCGISGDYNTNSSRFIVNPNNIRLETLQTQISPKLNSG